MNCEKRLSYKTPQEKLSSSDAPPPFLIVFLNILEHLLNNWYAYLLYLYHEAYFHYLQQPLAKLHIFNAIFHILRLVSFVSKNMYLFVKKAYYMHIFFALIRLPEFTILPFGEVKVGRFIFNISSL